MLFSAAFTLIAESTCAIPRIAKWTQTNPLEWSSFAGSREVHCNLSYFAGALDCGFDMPRR
jgi:hypothetical protein